MVRLKVGDVMEKQSVGRKVGDVMERTKCGAEGWRRNGKNKVWGRLARKWKERSGGAEGWRRSGKNKMWG